VSSKEPVNILLVDDQPAKLLSYEVILAPLGENLIKVTSGREALDRLLKTDIAVVLIDVCMPDLDGFELAAMIHDHPRHRKAAIIFVSAVHMTDIDRLRGYEVGGADYVAVPIVPEILRARVGVFADLYRKTQQLERLNLELEDRVVERTAELEASTSRLQRSEEALRESDRRKDEFLAMLSHELRNALAPMRNAIEIGRERVTTDRDLGWALGMLDRQTAHLTRLVDDLLDVSRITSGALEIQRERVDLAEIVRAAVEAVGPSLGDKHQSLHVALPTEPVALVADRIRVSQVLQNLLDNAYKFTPEGGSVWMVVEREGDQVVIRVRDSGAGISAEELPLLFELFYQSRHAARSPNGGLGIGLSLARRLAEMHGGSLDAFSDGKGHGSEFVVRLPLSGPASEAAPAPLPALNGTSTPRRILVVDDNRDSADTLALVLRRRGHDVRTAYDGVAAAKTVDEHGADVVLLDIGLPGTDGYEVARQVRDAPGGKQVLLIAVTGWGQREDLERSRAAGFDAHLVKPVDLHALHRLMAQGSRAAITDGHSARFTAPSH
jgi:signal transduction histidine kinase/ActR/RegA family two-component response regulator